MDVEIQIDEVLRRLTPASRFEWELRIAEIRLEQEKEAAARDRARVVELEAALERAVDAAVESNGRHHEPEAAH